MNAKSLLLDFFSKQSNPTILRRKERVLDFNDSKRIFYLKQGYVKIYTISSEGKELTLHIFSPSDIFPIMWEKIDGPNEYCYESLTPVEIYSCKLDKLEQLMKEKPDVNLEIIRQLTAFSKSSIRKLENKIFGNAYLQVLASILDLADFFGKSAKGKTVISYLFTHQDIASLSGLARETATIEINKLVSKKLISYNSRFIIIPKIEALKKEFYKDWEELR